LNAAFRPAILNVLDEFRNLILADRTIHDGIALDHRDFNVVTSGEKEAFPLILRSFFDCQPVPRVLGANQLREFFEGRELRIFR